MVKKPQKASEMLLQGKIFKDTFGILSSISKNDPWISFYGNILMIFRYLSDWTAISTVLTSSNILPLKPLNFLSEQKKLITATSIQHTKLGFELPNSQTLNWDLVSLLLYIFVLCVFSFRKAFILCYLEIQNDVIFFYFFFWLVNHYRRQLIET